ncbi:MAG TPA: DinB family protein [Balneolaceae bacterium]|nr:DinB family protein [Balneolaceae bacterium]
MALHGWQDNHPDSDEYDSFYRDYLDLLDTDNIIQTLTMQGQIMFTLIQNLSPDEADYRYADGKWSVKEVIGHLIDTERVMAYRAMCISRGDLTSLPGFDQDEYVENAHFEERSLTSLSAEYDAQRNANISMFNGLTEEQILQKGTANGVTVSVRALAHIIAGHEKHHLMILKEKYEVE